MLTELEQVQEKVDIAIMEEKLKAKNNNIEFDINKYRTLKDFIPEIESKYSEYIGISNGEIYILSEADEQVKLAAQSIGVYVATGAIASVGSNKVTIEGVQTASIRNYKIYGNSIQNGTPSPTSPVEVQSVGDKTKNLLSRDSLKIGNLGEDGFLNENIKYRVTTAYIKVNSNTNYIFNGNRKDGSKLNAIVCEYDNTYKLVARNVLYSSNYVTTTATTQYIRVCFFYNNTEPTTIEDNINLQIEQGTKVTEYEPYGYRIPIKVRGKNLFNVSGEVIHVYSTNLTVDGNTAIATATGSHTFTNTKVLIDEIEEGTTVTLSAEISVSSTNMPRLMLAYFDTSTNSSTNIAILDSTGSVKVTIPEKTTNTQVLCLLLYSNANGVSQAGYYATYTNIQLEVGTTATAYEPYQNTITNIYLNEPLRKIGDYADYIDFANKKVVRNIKEYTFLGDENLTLRSSQPADGTAIMCMDIISLFQIKDLLFCSRFKADENYTYTSVTKSCLFVNTSIDSRFHFCIEGVGKNIEEVQDIIKSWYTSGNPMKLVYVLTTVKEEKIELPDLPTINGIGTIEVNTLVSPSNIKVDY